MSAAIAASAIPNIFGGFAPFPNTIATALLAYQSEAIGYGFGIKFQAGKRTIGAMTNEEFNGLTEASLGAIVNIHNDELIGRMKAEMPKWIEIQQHYIEAGVTVEVMNANRTPSAWAEIITAFTSAAGQQIVATINGLSAEGKTSILSISPILSMIYFLSQQGSITPPEEEEPTGDGTTIKYTWQRFKLGESLTFPNGAKGVPDVAVTHSVTNTNLEIDIRIAKIDADLQPFKDGQYWDGRVQEAENINFVQAWVAERNHFNQVEQLLDIRNKII